MRNRQAAGRLFQVFREGRTERIRLRVIAAHDPDNARRAVGKGGYAVGDLRHGNINHRSGIVIESGIVDVLGKADDLALRLFEFRPVSLAEQNALADGIALWPKLASESLIYDCDAGCGGIVAIVKSAAAHQRDLEDVEIVRRNAHPTASVVTAAQRRSADDVEWHSESAF